MEQTQKPNTTKAVLAYLIELFPQCFIKEGEAKPLKIGIFQDIAERLSEDENVSKTQIRAALRQYTSSWRYLYGVKEGAKRVDLDGNEGDVVEQEHIEHAKEQLDASKAKVQARRKEAAKSQAKEQAAKKKSKPNVKKRVNVKKASAAKSKAVESRLIKSEEIVEGREVKVNMGKGDMPASIVEIQKDGIRVRLANGLVMSVKQEHLRL